MSKKVTLRIDIETGLNLSARQVGELVYQLINTGLEDARKTIETNEGDVVAAEMATLLDFTSIVACPVHPEAGESDQCVPLSTPAMNRCLVIVSGGVADYVHDEGVEVELFDWDNYRAETAEGRAEMHVPAHFVDLAQPAGVPVQRSALL
jgi:hypothetical protein